MSRIKGEMPDASGLIWYSVVAKTRGELVRHAVLHGPTRPSDATACCGKLMKARAVAKGKRCGKVTCRACLEDLSGIRGRNQQLRIKFGFVESGAHA